MLDVRTILQFTNFFAIHKYPHNFMNRHWDTGTGFSNQTGRIT